MALFKKATRAKEQRAKERIPNPASKQCVIELIEEEKKLMLLTWLLRKLHGLAPVEPEVTPCCRGAKIPRWRMELPETRPYILASSNEQ